MKIQILSDLHLEFKQYRIKIVEDAKLVIIAGDFTVARKLSQLKTFVKSTRKSVLYVAGNHDYYGGTIQGVNNYLNSIDAELDNFYFLNNRSIVHDHIHFVGCTLWSNFDLATQQDAYAMNIGPYISDFREINMDLTQSFTPLDCWM